jgi:hypothetical protein
MKSSGAMQRRRRFFLVLSIALLFIGVSLYQHWSAQKQNQTPQPAVSVPAGQELATRSLGRLAVKDSVSQEDYERDHFGSGWASTNGCDTRNRILQRDLEAEVLDADNCTVLSGSLQHDPYTGKAIAFTRGPGTSNAIQIEHIVALSDAWQKGATIFTPEKRQEFANDPLNLLAVDGPTNMQKSDSDAAEWLPPQKSFHCRYVARQIAIKLKYALWVTRAELSAMKRVLQTCPSQVLPKESKS